LDGRIPDAVLVGKLCLFLVAAEHLGAVLNPPMRATLWKCDSSIGRANTYSLSKKIKLDEKVKRIENGDEKHSNPAHQE
jgi:hypothetical protein